jgi:hypothetical protein
MAYANGMGAPQDNELTQEYLDGLLERFPGLGPKPEGTSEEMAERQIRREIGKLPEDIQRAGLWSIHKTLATHDVPPGVRLHLVSAVVNLSLLVAERWARPSARPDA